MYDFIDKMLTKAKLGNYKPIIFGCSKCKRPAATIELLFNTSLGKNDDGMALRIKGFSNTLSVIVGITPVTKQMFEDVRMLSTANPAKLNEMDPDMFGFICKECNAVYCRDCWSNYFDHFSHDGYHECVFASCPKGHRQMTSD